MELVSDSSNLSLILTAAIVIFITILLYIIKKRQGTAKKYVLLTGITNSGKTRIFCQLVYKQNLLTQISITPNVGVGQIEKSEATKAKSFDLVDIPGQDKIRHKFFQLYRKHAKAIVFVIDSSTFHKESKDVAQFLYEIITDPFVNKLKSKILILCNKQDIEMARGEKYIKSNLEKEIELLKKISSSALESTGKGSGESKSDLSSFVRRSDDKQFDFTDLKFNRVEFCEASSVERDNLKSLFEWLSTSL